MRLTTTAPNIKRVRGRALSGPAARLVSLAARQAQWRSLLALLLITDSLMVVAASGLAYFVRFELKLPIFQTEIVPHQHFYAALGVVLVSLWLAAFAVLGLYDRQNLFGGAEEYARVFRACSYCVLLVMVAGFLAPAFIVARGWLVLLWLFSVGLVGGGRFGLRRFVYALRRRGYCLSPAVIVGANSEGISLARQLLDWKTSDLQVLGFVDEKLPAGATVLRNLPCLGTVDDLEDAIRRYGIEEIVLASSAVSVRDNLLRIYQRCGLSRDINLRLSSGLYEIVTTGLTVRKFAEVPLVAINKVRLTGVDRVLKQALDLAVVIPGLLLCAPLFAFIALAIRIDSPGPVFYRRRVMGVNGRQFDAFKFRTMVVDGDRLLAARPDLQGLLGSHHKLKDDPRVTRLGRFLRRASLDELPQLFNVLRREMSLVGPRMISPEEMAAYDQWGLNLLTVKPGITGLWQVSGRSDVSYAQRVQLDMYYIRNWTIWLDLQLLWQTVPAVLRGHGAY